MRKTQFSLKVGRKNWRTLLGAYMAEHSTVWLTSKMLVALCLNKVECFIRPLCKMFTMYTISKWSSTCNFNSVKEQSGIGFIVDALFGSFAYLRSLCTAVELHINFVLLHLESQPMVYR